MADEYNDIIHNINSKAEKVVSEYRKLQEINKTLIEEKVELQSEIEREREQYRSLQGKYENLKSGKIMDLSTSDVKATKSKINGLVREIDSCIALLNVN